MSGMLNKSKILFLLIIAVALLPIVSCNNRAGVEGSNTNLIIADNIENSGYKNIIIPHRVLNTNTIDIVLDIGFSAWELDLYLV